MSGASLCTNSQGTLVGLPWVNCLENWLEATVYLQSFAKRGSGNPPRVPCDRFTESSGAE